MDDDASSPESGVATPQKETEMNLYLLERFDPAPQPDESGEERMSEEGLVSCVSITNRWRKRALKLKQLVRAMKQWCQKEEQEMIDFERLAEVEFAVKCSTSGNEECTRTMCKAFATMKKSCEIFLENKKTHTDDVKELDKAKTLHAGVETVHSDSNMKLAKAHSERADAAGNLAKPERKPAEALAEYARELAVAELAHSETLRQFSEVGCRLIPDDPSGLHRTLIEQLV